MKKTTRHTLFPLCGAFLLFNMLWFGSFAETPSHAASDPATVEGQDDGKEDSIEGPKGQTFYKWTDEDGHLYFTDDLAKVPERFRDQIETLELPRLREEELAKEEGQKPEKWESPPPSPPVARGSNSGSEKQDQSAREPYVYKEILFNQFIRIQVGMDEAEVLSRLGFPSLITPSDYFYGERSKYRLHTIRFIYLGNRDLNQKTTVIEIRDGKVANTERIFPF